MIHSDGSEGSRQEVHMSVHQWSSCDDVWRPVSPALVEPVTGTITNITQQQMSQSTLVMLPKHLLQLLLHDAPLRIFWKCLSSHIFYLYLMLLMVGLSYTCWFCLLGKRLVWLYSHRILGRVCSHFTLKRHGPFVAFYCKIMLISISYNYCSVLTTNKCFIETELTSELTS